MSLYLRPATESDCKLLFDWRNEPITQQNSFNQNEITYEEHTAWFEKMMADKSRKQYILMDGDVPVGQVRIAVADKEAEISYSIGESFHGKGFGTKIIGLLIAQVQQDFPFVEKLVAKVKSKNIPSKKIFFKNNFKETVAKYELSLQENS